MLVIEHFVIVVMDVIHRGHTFYRLHFAKMEKKERSEARSLAKKGGYDYEFEPDWSTKADLYPDQKPNTLYVGLSRARDLAIKDHYIIMKGGSSDPRVRFDLYKPGGMESKQSSTKFANLHPQWNEEFKFENYIPPDEMEIMYKACFGDDDEGEDADAKDPDASKPKDVEIPDLRPKTTEAEQTEDPKGRRGKPLVRQVPEDVQAKRQQKEWRLVCDLEDVDVASAADSLGQFTLDMLPLRSHKLQREWHTLKKAKYPKQEDDTEGNKDGDKTEGTKQKSYSAWNDDDDDDGDISGEVELLLRWLYEPDADSWAPPFANSQPEDAPTTYNEVRIGLFRARNLPAMDDNVLTPDSSDPTFKFAVEPNFPIEGGSKPKLYVSSTQYQTLFPVFREVIIIRGGPWGLEGQCSIDDYKLSISCEDIDSLSAADPMGTCEIPLKDLNGGKVVRKWCTLQLPEGVVPVNAEDIKKAGSPPAEVELFLQLAFNPSPPAKKPAKGAPYCFGLCGAPTAPEHFDGLEVPRATALATTTALTSQLKGCGAETVTLAKKNAQVLANNLKANERLLSQFASGYRSFLTNPNSRQSCLDLANALGVALAANQSAAAGRSLRIARENMVRFPLKIAIRLPTGFFVHVRSTASNALRSNSWRTGFLAVKWHSRSPLGGPPSAEESDGHSEKKGNKKAVAPTVSKTRDVSASAASDFMSSLESGIMNIVQDIVNVTELYNDLTRMNDNWNDALKALAFVENTIPKIVSAVEVVQSIVQVILKAIQGISFPPNPAVSAGCHPRNRLRQCWRQCASQVLVDMLHTARSIFKQAKSVYEVSKCRSQLAKSVGILSLFAKHLVDAITRVASLLSGEDGGKYTRFREGER